MPRAVMMAPDCLMRLASGRVSCSLMFDMPSVSTTTMSCTSGRLNSDSKICAKIAILTKHHHQFITSLTSKVTRNESNLATLPNTQYRKQLSHPSSDFSEALVNVGVLLLVGQSGH